MFILNDMHEADVVEVKDVVVDDVDEEGGVEGEAGNQLLQELGVPPKSPVPDRGEDFFIGEDDKETERNGMISSSVRKNKVVKLQTDRIFVQTLQTGV